MKLMMSRTDRPDVVGVPVFRTGLEMNDGSITTPRDVLRLLSRTAQELDRQQAHVPFVYDDHGDAVLMGKILKTVMTDQFELRSLVQILTPGQFMFLATLNTHAYVTPVVKMGIIVAVVVIPESRARCG